MSPIIHEHLDAIRNLCKQRFVKSLHVFGSAARSELTVDSDVDFLYKFDFDQIALLSNNQFDYAINLFIMEDELNKLLGRNIDLVFEDAVRNKFLKAEIDASKKLLYAE